MLCSHSLTMSHMVDYVKEHCSPKHEPTTQYIFDNNLGVIKPFMFQTIHKLTPHDPRKAEETNVKFNVLDVKENVKEEVSGYDLHKVEDTPPTCKPSEDDSTIVSNANISTMKLLNNEKNRSSILKEESTLPKTLPTADQSTKLIKNSLCNACGLSVYVCKFCFKCFDLKTTYKKHLNLHKNGKYSCVFCNRKLNRVNTFPDKHLFTKHLLCHVDSDNVTK